MMARATGTLIMPLEPVKLPSVVKRCFHGFTRAIAFAVLGIALASPAAAKELTSDQGIFIDMPSGFTAGEGDGKARFSYFGPDDVVEFDILIFAPGRYSSSESMAADLLQHMGAQGDTSSFLYEGRRAVIANTSFSLSGVPRTGYALFIVDGSGSSYALVASAETSQFSTCSELIISCLDAFSINRAARRDPGPVSQFLLPWPVERSARKTATLPGGQVQIHWSSEEADQELSVVEREYRILTTYLDNQTLWQDAWARFSRMVYRESAARLDAFTEAFSKSLVPGEPTETARRVLAWVQDFTYERASFGVDIVPPQIAAFERRGDCDARAILMAVTLERMGIDSVLMISRDYSHAMLAVDVPGGGQRFPFNGKEYLVAETTAKVGLGMIDASQTDWSKWLGVDLGE